MSNLTKCNTHTQKLIGIVIMVLGVPMQTNDNESIKKLIGGKSKTYIPFWKKEK